MEILNLAYQLDLIHSVKWDYLIILDACRADIFQQENFIKGEYRTVISPASHTSIWRFRTFPDKYPFVVYSATPMINSKRKVEGYYAPEHFLKVIDIWDIGWDNDLLTVPPWNVVKHAKEAKPGSIIWFVQPHAPWIGENRIVFKELGIDEKRARYSHVSALTELVKKGIITPEDIRKAHRGNLKLVLEYVEKLVEHYSGKIIVTADHGEFLGELGNWLHPKYTLHEVLRLVPWLEIRRT